MKEIFWRIEIDDMGPCEPVGEGKPIKESWGRKSASERIGGEKERMRIEAVK